MKGIVSLFLGIFGTFAFSWAGLILIPNYQIGHLDPQVDEDGNDPYPAPKSGMADRGRRIYAANGCVLLSQPASARRLCGFGHRTQMGRASQRAARLSLRTPRCAGQNEVGSGLVEHWKTRARRGGKRAARRKPNPSGTHHTSSITGDQSSARSFAVDTSRRRGVRASGNFTRAFSLDGYRCCLARSRGERPEHCRHNRRGQRQSAASYTAAWHHRHLYSPRSLVLDSNMPAYHFLYEKRRISGERAADALKLDERDAVPEGWEVVPTYDAKCLVAYLMSLDQSHPLKEVKATSAPPSSAPATSPAAAASPAPAPTKEAK